MISGSLDFISSGQMMLSDPMTVIDPHNLANNVTRSAFRICDIKEIFYKSFEYLIWELNEYKMMRSGGAEGGEE